MSNFLGDPGDVGQPQQRSAIISSAELHAREGVNLSKSMNFRTEPQLSVFLVLEKENGYADSWDEKTETYTFRGHDSTTVEGGKLTDQILMYPSGKPTDNGIFFKAATECKDGLRNEPLQIQLYEKLDTGVWFDKGIFNLVDARGIPRDGRNVYEFDLKPADHALPRELRDRFRDERLIPAAKKVAVWKRDKGRCAFCGSEFELHFVGTGTSISLLCTLHMQ